MGGPQSVDDGGGDTAGAVTPTLAEAVLLGSAKLVALTVTVVATVTVGAVNRPEFEIVPALADQVTPTVLAPLTAAVNCCVPPETALTVAGETATSTFGVTTTLALA